MSDDLSKRGPQDAARISLGEKHEVAYWTRELGVTSEQLSTAIAAVGNSAAAVRKHLGRE